MKVAVIADDLTGAAEIGGIGARYNLNVEIARQAAHHPASNMLVIDTDARSKTEANAVSTTTEAVNYVKQLKPQLLFKKVDSVLRGHVIAEVEAQCQLLGLKRALIVPANPALGRILAGGHYYVNNEPLHLTSFRHDPEFPVTESHVQTRFSLQGRQVTVQPHHVPLPAEGIIIGEAQTPQDVEAWTALLPTDTLAVGGSAFFNACLTQLHLPPAEHQPEQKRLSTPILYVSGSTFKPSAALIEQLHGQGGPVNYMPTPLLQSQTDGGLQQWAALTISQLKHQGKAVIAIPQIENAGQTYSAAKLRQQMASAVKLIFDGITVNELIVEGGSTAAAILEALNISSIFPVQEMAPGVIRNSVPTTPLFPNLHITLKPGSYAWSPQVWAF